MPLFKEYDKVVGVKDKWQLLAKFQCQLLAVQKKMYRNWSFNSYKLKNYMKLNFENSTSLKILKILFEPIILVALWRYLLNVSGGSGLAFCWCRLIQTSSTNTTKLSYLNQEHRKFSSSKWWSHFRCFFNFKLQVDKEREGKVAAPTALCLNCCRHICIQISSNFGERESFVSSHIPKVTSSLGRKYLFKSLPKCFGNSWLFLPKNK